MSPAELLRAARRLVAVPDPTTAGLWARAAALLGRQALEAALRDRLDQRAPGASSAPTSTQLLVLRALDDAPLATRASWAWSALSHACHHHGYELPPTAHELTLWLDVAEALVERARPRNLP